MYYSEVFKIIEAGIDRDKEKVNSFAKLLAKKMKDDGEIKASERIFSILEKKNRGNVVTDSLVPPPVDQESRLNIVEVDYHPEKSQLILSPSVEMKLDDFIQTVNNKSQMEAIGLDFNMSLLLYGYPGCGKTSAAKYLAAQLGLPLVVARLDTLISSLLGNTAKNIHKMFEFAKRQPCVLFLDEFDAIAKARDDQHELGELKRVVNSLLQNMDEYCKDGILIAATNHQELLDNAIWRRFQTVIEMIKPGNREIRIMFEQLPEFIDQSAIKVSQWKKIEEALSGLSYSDVKNILNNMVKKLVIKGRNQMEFVDVIGETYLFRNHGDFSVEDMANYMIECGVPKKYTASYLEISRRKIDAFTGKEDKNE